MNPTRTTRSRAAGVLATLITSTLAAGALTATISSPHSSTANAAGTSTNATAAGASALQAATPGALAGDRVYLRIRDGRISESSGLTLDRTGQYLYTHQDAGNRSTQIYALDRNGTTRTTINLPAGANLDWEDMDRGTTSTGAPALFIGDVGDAWRYEKGKRREFAVLRINEPSISAATASSMTASGLTKWRLRYADNGNRNSESIAVQPRTNRLFVVDKQNKTSATNAAVWVAPAQLSTSSVNTMTRVNKLPLREATAAAFSPDGSKFAVRDYQRVYLWQVNGGDVAAALRTNPKVRTLPAQGQGESMTFTADGKRLLVGSEGANAPVWEVSLPTQTASTASMTPTAATTPLAAAAQQPASTGSSVGKFALLGTGVGLLIGAGIAVLVLRRRKEGLATQTAGGKGTGARDERHDEPTPLQFH